MNYGNNFIESCAAKIVKINEKIINLDENIPFNFVILKEISLHFSNFKKQLGLQSPRESCKALMKFTSSALHSIEKFKEITYNIIQENVKDNMSGYLATS